METYKSVWREEREKDKRYALNLSLIILAVGPFLVFTGFLHKFGEHLPTGLLAFFFGAWVVSAYYAALAK